MKLGWRETKWDKERRKEMEQYLPNLPNLPQQVPTAFQGRRSRRENLELIQRHARILRGDAALKYLMELASAGQVRIQTETARQSLRALKIQIPERTTLAEPEFILHVFTDEKGTPIVLDIPTSAFSDKEFVSALAEAYPKSFFGAILKEMEKPEWSGIRPMLRGLAKGMLGMIPVYTAEAVVSAVMGAIGSGTGVGAAAGAAGVAHGISGVIKGIRTVKGAVKAYQVWKRLQELKKTSFLARGIYEGVRGLAAAAIPEYIQRRYAGAGEKRSWLPAVASAVPDFVLGMLPAGAGLSRGKQVAVEALKGFGIPVGSAVMFEYAAAKEEGRTPQVLAAAGMGMTVPMAMGAGRYILGKVFGRLGSGREVPVPEVPVPVPEPARTPSSAEARRASAIRENIPAALDIPANIPLREGVVVVGSVLGRAGIGAERQRVLGVLYPAYGVRRAQAVSPFVTVNSPQSLGLEWFIQLPSREQATREIFGAFNALMRKVDGDEAKEIGGILGEIYERMPEGAKRILENPPEILTGDVKGVVADASEVFLSALDAYMGGVGGQRLLDIKHRNIHRYILLSLIREGTGWSYRPITAVHADGTAELGGREQVSLSGLLAQIRSRGLERELEERLGAILGEAESIFFRDRSDILEVFRQFPELRLWFWAKVLSGKGLTEQGRKLRSGVLNMLYSGIYADMTDLLGIRSYLGGEFSAKGIRHAILWNDPQTGVKRTGVDIARILLTDKEGKDWAKWVQETMLPSRKEAKAGVPSEAPREVPKEVSPKPEVPEEPQVPKEPEAPKEPEVILSEEAQTAVTERAAEKAVEQVAEHAAKQLPSEAKKAIEQEMLPPVETRARRRIEGELPTALERAIERTDVLEGRLLEGAPRRETGRLPTAKERAMRRAEAILWWTAEQKSRVRPEEAFKPPEIPQPAEPTGIIVPRAWAERVQPEFALYEPPKTEEPRILPSEKASNLRPIHMFVDTTAVLTSSDIERLTQVMRDTVLSKPTEEVRVTEGQIPEPVREVVSEVVLPEAQQTGVSIGDSEGNAALEAVAVAVEASAKPTPKARTRRAKAPKAEAPVETPTEAPAEAPAEKPAEKPSGAKLKLQRAAQKVKEQLKQERKKVAEIQQELQAEEVLPSTQEVTPATRPKQVQPPLEFSEVEQPVLKFEGQEVAQPVPEGEVTVVPQETVATAQPKLKMAFTLGKAAKEKTEAETGKVKFRFSRIVKSAEEELEEQIEEAVAKLDQPTPTPEAVAEGAQRLAETTQQRKGLKLSLDKVKGIKKQKAAEEEVIADLKETAKQVKSEEEPKKGKKRKWRIVGDSGEVFEGETVEPRNVGAPETRDYNKRISWRIAPPAVAPDRRTLHRILVTANEHSTANGFFVIGSDDLYAGVSWDEAGMRITLKGLEQLSGKGISGEQLIPQAELMLYGMLDNPEFRRRLWEALPADVTRDMTDEQFTALLRRMADAVLRDLYFYARIHDADFLQHPLVLPVTIVRIGHTGKGSQFISFQVLRDRIRGRELVFNLMEIDLAQFAEVLKKFKELHGDDFARIRKYLYPSKKDFRPMLHEVTHHIIEQSVNLIPPHMWDEIKSALVRHLDEIMAVFKADPQERKALLEFKRLVELHGAEAVKHIPTYDQRLLIAEFLNEFMTALLTQKLRPFVDRIWDYHTGNAFRRLLAWLWFNIRMWVHTLKEIAHRITGSRSSLDMELDRIALSIADIARNIQVYNPTERRLVLSAPTRRLFRLTLRKEGIKETGQELPPTTQEAVAPVSETKPTVEAEIKPEVEAVQQAVVDEAVNKTKLKLSKAKIVSEAIEEAEEEGWGLFDTEALEEVTREIAEMRKQPEGVIVGEETEAWETGVSEWVRDIYELRGIPVEEEPKRVGEIAEAVTEEAMLAAEEVVAKERQHVRRSYLLGQMPLNRIVLLSPYSEVVTTALNLRTPVPSPEVVLEAFPEFLTNIARQFLGRDLNNAEVRFIRNLTNDLKRRFADTQEPFPYKVWQEALTENRDKIYRLLLGQLGQKGELEIPEDLKGQLRHTYGQLRNFYFATVKKKWSGEYWQLFEQTVRERFRERMRILEQQYGGEIPPNLRLQLQNAETFINTALAQIKRSIEKHGLSNEEIMAVYGMPIANALAMDIRHVLNDNEIFAITNAYRLLGLLGEEADLSTLYEYYNGKVNMALPLSYSHPIFLRRSLFAPEGVKVGSREQIKHATDVLRRLLGGIIGLEHAYVEMVTQEGWIDTLYAFYRRLSAGENISVHNLPTSMQVLTVIPLNYITKALAYIDYAAKVSDELTRHRALVIAENELRRGLVHTQHILLGDILRALAAYPELGSIRQRLRHIWQSGWVNRSARRTPYERANEFMSIFELLYDGLTYMARGDAKLSEIFDISADLAEAIKQVQSHYGSALNPITFAPLLSLADERTVFWQPITVTPQWYRSVELATVFLPQMQEVLSVPNLAEHFPKANDVSWLALKARDWAKKATNIQYLAPLRQMDTTAENIHKNFATALMDIFGLQGEERTVGNLAKILYEIYKEVASQYGVSLPEPKNVRDMNALHQQVIVPFVQFTLHKTFTEPDKVYATLANWHKQTYSKIRSKDAGEKLTGQSHKIAETLAGMVASELLSDIYAHMHLSQYKVSEGDIVPEFPTMLHHLVDLIHTAMYWRRLLVGRTATGEKEHIYPFFRDNMLASLLFGGWKSLSNPRWGAAERRFTRLGLLEILTAPRGASHLRSELLLTLMNYMFQPKETLAWEKFLDMAIDIAGELYGFDNPTNIRDRVISVLTNFMSSPSWEQIVDKWGVAAGTKLEFMRRVAAAGLDADTLFTNEATFASLYRLWSTRAIPADEVPTEADVVIALTMFGMLADQLTLQNMFIQHTHAPVTIPTTGMITAHWFANMLTSTQIKTFKRVGERNFVLQTVENPFKGIMPQYDPDVVKVLGVMIDTLHGQVLREIHAPASELLMTVSEALFPTESSAYYTAIDPRSYYDYARYLSTQYGRAYLDTLVNDAFSNVSVAPETSANWRRLVAVINDQIDKSPNVQVGVALKNAYGAMRGLISALAHDKTNEAIEYWNTLQRTLTFIVDNLPLEYSDERALDLNDYKNGLAWLMLHAVVPTMVEDGLMNQVRGIKAKELKKSEVASVILAGVPAVLEKSNVTPVIREFLEGVFDLEGVSTGFANIERARQAAKQLEPYLGSFDRFLSDWENLWSSYGWGILGERYGIASYQLGQTVAALQQRLLGKMLDEIEQDLATEMRTQIATAQQPVEIAHRIVDLSQIPDAEAKMYRPQIDAVMKVAQVNTDAAVALSNFEKAVIAFRGALASLPTSEIALTQLYRTRESLHQSLQVFGRAIANILAQTQTLLPHDILFAPIQERKFAPTETYLRQTFGGLVGDYADTLDTVVASLRGLVDSIRQMIAETQQGRLRLSRDALLALHDTLDYLLPNIADLSLERKRLSAIAQLHEQPDNIDLMKRIVGGGYIASSGARHWRIETGEIATPDALPSVFQPKPNWKIVDYMRAFFGNIHGWMKSLGRAGWMLSNTIMMINPVTTGERTYLFTEALKAINAIDLVAEQMRTAGLDETDIQLAKIFAMFRLAGLNPSDPDTYIAMRRDIDNILEVMRKYGERVKRGDVNSPTAGHWQDNTPITVLEHLRNFFDMVAEAMVYGTDGRLGDVVKYSEQIAQHMRQFLDNAYQRYAQAGIPFVGREALNYIQNYLPFVPHRLGNHLITWVTEALRGSGTKLASALDELYAALASEERMSVFETVARHRRHLPAAILLLATEMQPETVLLGYSHGLGNYVGEYMTLVGHARALTSHPEWRRFLPKLATYMETQPVPTAEGILEAWADDIVAEASQVIKGTDIGRQLANALRALHGTLHPTMPVDPASVVRLDEVKGLITQLSQLGQGKDLMQFLEAVRGKHGVFGYMMLREIINPQTQSSPIYAMLSSLPIAAYWTIHRTNVANLLEGLATTYQMARSGKDLWLATLRQVASYWGALHKVFKNGMKSYWETYIKSLFSGRISIDDIENWFNDPAAWGMLTRFIDMFYQNILTADKFTLLPSLWLHLIHFNLSEMITTMKSGIERMHFFETEVAPLLRGYIEGKLTPEERMRLEEICVAHQIYNPDVLIETARNYVMLQEGAVSTDNLINQAKALFVARAVMERHHEYGALDMPPMWHAHPFIRMTLYWLKSWSLQHTHKLFYHMWGRWNEMRKRIAASTTLSPAQKEKLLQDLFKRQLGVILNGLALVGVMGLFWRQYYAWTGGRHTDPHFVEPDGAPKLTGLLHLALDIASLPTSMFGILSDWTFTIRDAMYSRNPTELAGLIVSPLVQYWAQVAYDIMRMGYVVAQELSGISGAQIENIKRDVLTHLIRSTPLQGHFARPLIRGVRMGERQERADLVYNIFPETRKIFGDRTTAKWRIMLNHILPALRDGKSADLARRLLRCDPEEVFEMLAAGGLAQPTEIRAIIKGLHEYYKKTDPQVAEFIQQHMSSLEAIMANNTAKMHNVGAFTALVTTELVNAMKDLPQRLRHQFLTHIAIGAISHIADPANFYKFSGDMHQLITKIGDKAAPRAQLLKLLARAVFFERLVEAMQEEGSMTRDDAIKFIFALGDRATGYKTMLSIEPPIKEFGGATAFSRAYHKAFVASIPDVVLATAAIFPELVDPQLQDIQKRYLNLYFGYFNDLVRKGYSEREASYIAAIQVVNTPEYRNMLIGYGEQLVQGSAALFNLLAGEHPSEHITALPTLAEANLQRWYSYWRIKELEGETALPSAVQSVPQVRR